MLELSEQEFQTRIVNMLKILKDKADGMQEQIGNVNSEMKIIRKKPN